MTERKTKKKTVPAVKAKKQARKPDFENALEEIVTDDKVREGTRPGVSSQHPGADDSPRPPDNLVKVDREPSKAPKALAPVLKIPFSIWAGVSEISEMKLTDLEAEEWAEPIIALLEYYFPGRIPEIIWIWLMFLSATEKVIDSRVKIRYEKRKERAHSQTSSAPRESAVPTAQPAPVHNGAEPAEDFPQE